jgi:hypothetical protein
MDANMNAAPTQGAFEVAAYETSARGHEVVVASADGAPGDAAEAAPPRAEQGRDCLTDRGRRRCGVGALVLLALGGGLLLAPPPVGTLVALGVCMIGAAFGSLAVPLRFRRPVLGRSVLALCAALLVVWVAPIAFEALGSRASSARVPQPLAARP